MPFNCVCTFYMHFCREVLHTDTNSHFVSQPVTVRIPPVSLSPRTRTHQYLLTDTHFWNLQSLNCRNYTWDIFLLRPDAFPFTPGRILSSWTQLEKSVSTFFLFTQAFQIHVCLPPPPYWFPFPVHTHLLDNFVESHINKTYITTAPRTHYCTWIATETLQVLIPTPISLSYSFLHTNIFIDSSHKRIAEITAEIYTLAYRGYLQIWLKFVESTRVPDHLWAKLMCIFCGSTRLFTPSLW